MAEKSDALRGIKYMKKHILKNGILETWRTKRNGVLSDGRTKQVSLYNSSFLNLKSKTIV